jgi:hypothetical protein
MPARKPSTDPAMNIEGALRIPDLSGFEGTNKGRVRCKTCKTSGPVDEIWVLSCLAGHPEECPDEHCTVRHTTKGRMSRHVQAKHPKLWVTDETKEERTKRLKIERRQALREAGIREDSAA